MKKVRMSGPDAVRVAAIMSVIVLHAISYTQSFAEPFGFKWHINVYLRNLTVASVPLFLMLTGYLQRTKKFCASYYRGIFPLYVSYFAISAISMAVDAIKRGIAGNMDLSFVTAVFKIFNFSANGYAWYFEMYLGLFLMIPFLNMIYGGIKTRGGKLIMIATLAFLTLLPDTILGFSPYYDGAGGTVALNILPDFFKSIYPFTYYFIGSFISEYKPKLSACKKFIFLLAAPLIPCAFISWFSNTRGAYAWYMFNGFQNIAVCITAIAVFLALYDTELRVNICKKALALVSQCTFEIYLFSCIYDDLIYNVFDLDAKYPTVFAVLIVFVASFTSALLLRLVLKPINRGVFSVFDKFAQKFTPEF